jgi:plasmid stabilization system protein ParE
MPASYRVILSPEAAADLQALYDYIALDSPQNAATMVGRLLDAIESLETFPHRNVARHQSRRIKHRVRSLPVKPYLVDFRVLDDRQAVIILSVRHGARRRPRF